ncbi:hypothetical protein [Streptacidiphilus cavernicola]|uniref:DUF4386 domain-containing protein n=1 Tax=Streptacidiphilus cavernicola TaxID=3342716 RepID=A0ABV6VWE5_9ACTN
MTTLITATAATASATRATDPRTRRRGLLSLPALVGVGYSLSWVAALSVGPGNLAADATGAQVAAAYLGHGAAGAAQYVLSEGLPAAGLAVIGLALAAAARRDGRIRATRTVAVGALAAAAISAVQCLLGLLLVLSAVPDAAHGGGTGRAQLLFELVNRMDGVKMLVLAVLALGAAALARTGLPARWLRHPDYALAATITASGVGYLLLQDGLALFAYLSLPLLMLWATGTGLALARKGR